MSGIYVTFEGIDGSGKTTTSNAVIEELKVRAGNRRLPNILKTHQPGSTPLGKHIRKLVKTPQLVSPDIVMDDLSRQALYMVDAISFIKTLLEPALTLGDIVFSDRSTFISAMVYGLTDGLSLLEIEKLYSLITPPKIDRLYIVRCPWKVAKQRLHNSRDKADHYDNKGSDFFDRLSNTYNNLITSNAEQTALVSSIVSLDNIKYIDSTLPQAKLVDDIVTDLLGLIDEREAWL